MEEEVIKELRNTFLDESEEDIENIESQLIKVEEDPEDKRILENLMRSAHTIKGSAASVDFDHLAKFAHKIENLVEEIREGVTPFSTDIVTVLFEAVDYLKKYVQSLRSDMNSTIDTDSIEAKIVSFSSANAITTQNKQEERPEGPTFGIFSEEPSVEDSVNSTANEQVQESATVSPEVEVHDPKIASETEPAGQRNLSEDQSYQSDFIRIPLHKIDSLLNYFGEQAILQSTLEDAKTDIVKNQDRLEKTIMQLSKITYDLQQTTMSLRMFSLKNMFQKMKRTSRQVATSLGKKVKIVLHGEGTELDKTLIDNLNGPITHLIRNAVDHGIEMPDVRSAAGKNEVGIITISASQQHGNFVLEIKDDGAGLDEDKILKKAIASGIASSKRRYSKAEIFQFIFSSGFSTKDKVTDISGRGVGMDAVNQAISNMHGTLMIDSTLGKGTILSIKLPLSMSIFNGMVFKVNNNRFVIPSSEIKEISRFNEGNTRRIDRNLRILEKSDHTMTLFDLGLILDGKEVKNENNKVAFIVTKNGKDIALEINEIISNQRIVQKRLGEEFENRSEFSGGAILGDGGVALILNLGKISGLEFRK